MALTTLQVIRVTYYTQEYKKEMKFKIDYIR